MHHLGLGIEKSALMNPESSYEFKIHLSGDLTKYNLAIYWDNPESLSKTTLKNENSSCNQTF